MWPPEARRDPAMVKSPPWSRPGGGMDRARLEHLVAQGAAPDAKPLPASKHMLEQFIMLAHGIAPDIDIVDPVLDAVRDLWPDKSGRPESGELLDRTLAAMGTVDAHHWRSMG
jgi:hypothetical protein